jgi:hypothetical protein
LGFSCFATNLPRSALRERLDIMMFEVKAS